MATLLRIKLVLPCGFKSLYAFISEYRTFLGEANETFSSNVCLAKKKYFKKALKFLRLPMTQFASSVTSQSWP